jgi:serine/threonine protein kinase
VVSNVRLSYGRGVAGPGIKVGAHLPGDRWTIGELFATGRRYRLYAGADAHLDGKRVAIKVPRTDVWASADDARAAFALEGEFLASPSALIPEPLDFLDVDGWPVLVMEFISGETLAAQIEAGREVGALRAVAIVRELALFATDMRARGFVFRDFSPEHVLLGLDDVVHVVGTGNAVRKDAVRENAVREDESTTDIASLGQLLLALSPATSALVALAKRATGDAASRQYESAAEFARDLASLRIEVAEPAPVARRAAPPVAVAAPPIRKDAPQKKRHILRWVAVLLFGIAGAATAVYFLAFHGR